tara:strand:- start:57 stop:350 length:294 start_codon:yes stop_codon:yes gene_type:complete
MKVTMTLRQVEEKRTTTIQKANNFRRSPTGRRPLPPTPARRRPLPAAVYPSLASVLMQFQHARMLLELGMLEISVALLVVLCLWLLTRRRQAPASFS